MRRRAFVTGVGSAACLSLLAGCNTSDQPTTGTATGTGTPTESGDTADKPDGIYVQSFRESMSMQGQASSGDYTFALMFTVPHTFWTVTGSTVSKTTKEPEDSLHLMATVWDAQTGTVLPDTGLSVEITRDGSLVSEEVIYPMLSQPMGFHYGGNFQLGGDGTYAVELSVGGTNIRRTGAFAGRFESPASVEMPLEFTEERRREISTRSIDQAGRQGALRPRESGIPQAVLPDESDLPGTVRGSARSDDAQFVVTTVDSASRVGADGKQYLAVSARTRYNRYVLPAMALSATLVRDGSTVYGGPLERTLSPDLGYHYGAAVDAIQSGDDLTLSVDTPPNVARHEGYETAFLQLEDVTITL